MTANGFASIALTAEGMAFFCSRGLVDMLRLAFEAPDGRGGDAITWLGVAITGGIAPCEVWCAAIFAASERSGEGWGSLILAIWVGAGEGRI